MANDSSDKMMIFNYVVAYLDIMGQKDSLKQLPKVLLADTDPNSYMPQIEETYGKTHQIRSLIKHYLEGMQENTKRIGHELFYDNLSDEQRKNIEDMFSPIEFRYFGDSVAIYSKLTNTGGMLSVNPIYAILPGIAFLMLMGFSNHIVLRGGIDMGIAVEWEEFGIYGSALYSAYEIESTIADYPRIVLGKELIDYLSYWKNNQGTDFVSKLNKQVANNCFSVIGKDGDGRPIIDFLNDNMQSLFGKTDRDKIFNMLQPHVANGLDFVKKEYARFEKEKNLNLSQRYKLLYDYFLSKAKNWKLELK
ncbi:MAG: hypothetical protein ABSB11_10815 [Sedimentisphaerales bacterium]|jgi:hypothetical protein